MNFGKDATFSLIGKALNQTGLEAYDPICKILYDDVGALVNSMMKGIQKADKDDVIQFVVMKMFRALPRFYQTSIKNNNTEQQRNAYLKRAVQNEVKSFFKSKAEKSREIKISETLAQKDSFEIKIETIDELYRNLKTVFEFNTTPDRLIAFVYNRLLSALSGKNGKPQEISAIFYSKEIIELYEKMIYDLSETLHCEIPYEVLEPLLIKVEKCPNAMFSLSPRTITDSSSEFVKKLKKTNINPEMNNNE